MPKIHERVIILQQATGDFALKLSKIVRAHEIELDQSVLSFGQVIVNLKSENKIYHNDYQRDVEKALEEVVKEHQLTLGETVSLLTGQINNDVKYLIRWERHGDLSKEGGWA